MPLLGCFALLRGCGLLLQTEYGGLSVGRSTVCHDRELRKNGRTDCDAVWDVDSPKEPCIRWGSRYPYVNRAILRGKSGRTRTCQGMAGGRHTQSDSAGGSTGSERMPIGVY